MSLMMKYIFNQEFLFCFYKYFQVCYNKIERSLKYLKGLYIEIIDIIKVCFKVFLNMCNVDKCYMYI